MYEAAIKSFGWREPLDNVIIGAKPRAAYEQPPLRTAILALLLAQEFGDLTIARRLRALLCESLAEPKCFGEDESEFGFFFHLKEKW